MESEGESGKVNVSNKVKKLLESANIKKYSFTKRDKTIKYFNAGTSEE